MNYKALRTDFTEEELKLSWSEWMWDKCPYWARKFIRKFKRWWKYTVHLWKENPWNEYDQLFHVMQLELSIMAEEFKNNPLTLSSEQDAKDMQKVITLLDRYMNEYYSSRYYDEGKIKEDVFEMEMSEFQEWLDKPLLWKEGYSTEGWHKSMERDQKCLSIAMKLIEQKSPGWWQ